MRFSDGVKVLMFPSARCLVCGSDYCTAPYPFCADCASDYALLLLEGCVDCGARPKDCNCVKVSPCIRLYWLFSYKGETARSIIYSLKQHRSFPDFAYFARRLYEQMISVSGESMTFDCVCYVPRGKAGIAQYGYDHSRLLALRIAELFGIPCKPLIEHTGVSGEQKRLSREYRGTAAKTRFRPNAAELAEEKYPYKRVLLVDDIVTTGTTMGECARILKNNGVKQVYGAFIAHTPEGQKKGRVQF